MYTTHLEHLLSGAPSGPQRDVPTEYPEWEKHPLRVLKTLPFRKDVAMVWAKICSLRFNPPKGLSPPLDTHY